MRKLSHFKIDKNVISSLYLIKLTKESNTLLCIDSLNKEELLIAPSDAALLAAFIDAEVVCCSGMQICKVFVEKDDDSKYLSTTPVTNLTAKDKSMLDGFIHLVNDYLNECEDYEDYTSSKLKEAIALCKSQTGNDLYLSLFCIRNLIDSLVASYNARTGIGIGNSTVTSIASITAMTVLSKDVITSAKIILAYKLLLSILDDVAIGNVTDLDEIVNTFIDKNLSYLEILVKVLEPSIRKSSSF